MKGSIKLTGRKLIGIAMLTALFLGLIIYGVVLVGVKDAFLVIGGVLGLCVFLYIAVSLIGT